MVDVSHVSKAGMMQAAEVSRSPVAATHTACRALRDHPRNIDDEQIRACAETDGVVGLVGVGGMVGVVRFFQHFAIKDNDGIRTQYRQIALGQRYGATLHMTVLAGWAALPVICRASKPAYLRKAPK